MLRKERSSQNTPNSRHTVGGDRSSVWRIRPDDKTSSSNVVVVGVAGEDRVAVQLGDNLSLDRLNLEKVCIRNDLRLSSVFCQNFEFFPITHA